MHIRKILLVIVLAFCINDNAFGADKNYESLNVKDIASLVAVGEPKVKVVYVFTSWCKYCKVGFVKLKEIASHYTKDDLKVLPISLDEKQSQFESFVEEYNQETIIPKVYRVIYSNPRDMVKELANAKIQYQGSIPHVTVFNKDGKVLIDGKFDAEYLAALVDSLIKK